MDRPDIDPQVGRLALAQPGRGVDARDDRVPALTGVGTSRVLSQFLELGRVHAAFEFLGEVDVDIGAHRLHHIDVRLERDPVRPGVRADQRGVLEALRADPHDQVAGRVGALQRMPEPVGERDVPERRVQRAVIDGGGDEVHRGRADEAGHEQVVRALVELLGRPDLLELAVTHHRHPVAQGHGLGLVVRDVDHGGAEPPLDPGDLGAHLHPQLRVQVGQRLVHQERRRVADDGPAHRDPLPLAAGQVGRLAFQVLGQVEDPGRIVDLLVDGGLRRLGQLEREAHVFPDRHVRVQSVALEHHGDVTVLGRLVVDHLAADPQLALGDVFQAGDHVERRRLPAARRADQDDELAVGDVEVNAIDRQRAIREALGDLIQNDVSHCFSFVPGPARLALDRA